MKVLKINKDAKNFKVTFVIPAHNEEGNLPELIEALFGFWKKYIYEIIIVNDSSSDSTRKVAEGLKKEFGSIKIINRRPPNGVGLALQEGYRAVDEKCPWTLSMDADFIYNIPELKRLFSVAQTGNYDGVMGSRYIKQGRLVNYPFIKKMSNRAYHFVIRKSLGIKQKDLTNNFKLYRTEIFKKIKWKSSDFAINAETGIIPIMMGYKIKEVPVSWIQRIFDKSDFKVFGLAKSYLNIISRVKKMKKN